MGACKACRAAKVKCDQVFPCKRCLRLGKECIPHESKQGQNPARSKKRARQEQLNGNAIAVGCPEIANAAPPTSDSTLATSEDAAIACEMIQNHKQATTTKTPHYGLLALIRSWIALAIKRRSFALWARAGTVAARCGISMDDVLCESPIIIDGQPQQNQEARRGMDFLYPFLLTPSQEQSVVGRSLTVGEIPDTLWKSIGISSSTISSTSSTLEATLADRWVFVRETYRGITRFYASPGFERYIATTKLIEDTFRANLMQVTDLWTPVSDSGTKKDFLKGFAAQLNQHDKPNRTNIKPSKYTNVPILVYKTEQQQRNDSNSFSSTDHNEKEKEILRVDKLIFTIIPDVDRFVSGLEFIPPKTFFHKVSNNNNIINNEPSISTIMESLDDLCMEAENLTSDDSDEDDFKLIYSILNDS